MSKLHKKMVALGDMSKRTYNDVVAACGEPRETVPARFTDIGEGTRSTWSDGLLTITFTFDKEGNYCGICHHRNLEPYIWLSAITAVIIAGSLILGSYMRSRAADETPDAASMEALLVENENIWLHDNTAGICLSDLDFDGVPELLATNTDIIWYDELDSYYFGDSEVAVYSLADGKVTPLGGYTTDEYCFLATLHLFTGGDGSRGWYYTSGGDVWLLSLENGAVTTAAATSMPDISGGDEAMKLIRNESWVSNQSDSPDTSLVAEDIAAITAEYFAQ
ncbi:MAG: hypothetical protein EOM54_01505 [Clostridia bacterium]|nr:hypothetical protein [Clostridia bacterium]